jgi:hypothetical protein
MIVDIKEYAQMLGVVPGAIRKRMNAARNDKKTYMSVLPGVMDAKKMGNSWVFTLNPKKLPKPVK